MNEILKNKIIVLAIANRRFYFLKYRRSYPSLRPLHTFIYASLFRFILPKGSISTHSLAFIKVCKSYEHISFRDALKLRE